MATAAAALVARARREIQHQFFEADAVRPDRAIGFSPANGFERRMFGRYCSRGIIRESVDGKYWLDVVAYDVDLQQRHRRVRAVLLAIIAMLAILVLAGEFQGHSLLNATSAPPVH